MKVVGLLAWYDEPAIWLREAVSFAAKFCDHVVAVDGAYALYPDGRAQSDLEQAEAILHAAHAADIGCTIHRPHDVWLGNQIEKRNVMFELGRQTGADWFFVFDADDMLVHMPADARERLERADEDVAVYTLGGHRYHRGLFRALPKLRVEDAHYHYLAERDGETVHLRGDEQAHRLEPFLNLTDLRVAHRRTARSSERLASSAAYRRLIEAQALEKTTPEQWAGVPA
jgi:hypothetical protein